MGPLEKSLLLWSLYMGLHLMLTCQGEWLQELEGKVMGRKRATSFCLEWHIQFSPSAAVGLLKS